eukprot:SAG22_NODE_52_length_24288_cov_15.594568_24_plen_94_part_00
MESEPSDYHSGYLNLYFRCTQACIPIMQYQSDRTYRYDSVVLQPYQYSTYDLLSRAKKASSRHASRIGDVEFGTSTCEPAPVRVRAKGVARLK